ncbi:MAG TPA: ATP-binding protein [Flexilinea sp.]|mgnify:FL=1|nr:ATP-binding protein [Flexilinea sp.]
MTANIYPFTAIVGQEQMVRALILNAIDPRIGGVLIRGERGTAKSTAARGLAAVLPEEEVIAECRFGCDPDDELHWCTECKERKAKGIPMTRTRRKTPFINLPVSATEDRVVGTLDIEKALKTGEKSFEPGILASANRGILYIDEVNLLEDHVVDILLDSAAMGVNSIEREGISFSHPARFILVGTMNPEEGDLRPQLLDRFALSVDIRGIEDARERVEIMRRTLRFEDSPELFQAEWQKSEAELTEKIESARKRLASVRYTSRDLITIASLTSSLKVEGHRADLVILKAARAQAAFENHPSVTDLDIAMAAELALPHRLQKGPFSESTVGTDELKQRIDELHGKTSDSTSFQSESDAGDEEKKI